MKRKTSYYVIPDCFGGIPTNTYFSITGELMVGHNPNSEEFNLSKKTKAHKHTFAKQYKEFEQNNKSTTHNKVRHAQNVSQKPEVSKDKLVVLPSKTETPEMSDFIRWINKEIFN